MRKRLRDGAIARRKPVRVSRIPGRKSRLARLGGFRPLLARSRTGARGSRMGREAGRARTFAWRLSRPITTTQDRRVLNLLMRIGVHVDARSEATLRISHAPRAGGAPSPGNGRSFAAWKPRSGLSLHALPLRPGRTRKAPRTIPDRPQLRAMAGHGLGARRRSPEARPFSGPLRSRGSIAAWPPRRRATREPVSGWAARAPLAGLRRPSGPRGSVAAPRLAAAAATSTGRSGGGRQRSWERHGPAPGRPGTLAVLARSWPPHDCARPGAPAARPMRGEGAAWSGGGSRTAGAGWTGAGSAGTRMRRLATPQPEAAWGRPASAVSRPRLGGAAPGSPRSPWPASAREPAPAALAWRRSEPRAPGAIRGEAKLVHRLSAPASSAAQAPPPVGAGFARPQEIGGESVEWRVRTLVRQSLDAWKRKEMSPVRLAEAAARTIERRLVRDLERLGR